MNRRASSPQDPVGDLVERQSSEEYLLSKILRPLATQPGEESAWDLMPVENLVPLLFSWEDGLTTRGVITRLQTVLLSENTITITVVNDKPIFGEGNVPASELLSLLQRRVGELRASNRLCSVCWGLMEEQCKVGRPRLYCSPTCRKRASREKRMQGGGQ